MDLVPEILLVYGTTLRQLDQLTEARWAYFVGGKLAKQAKDRLLQASIAQRRSWVEFVDGKFSQALDLLRGAAGMFSELEDRNRHGKVLVDMALQYYHREMPEEAIPCANSALRKLDERELKNRFSAHQVLAGSFNALKKEKEALDHLKTAKALASRCGRAVGIRFTWFEARMKRDLLPLEAVANTFAEAAAFFSEIGEVMDSSLATLEYAQCQLSLGNYQEVSRVARSLKNLAFQVEGEVAASALMHVYREGLRSDVTKAVLDAAIQALEGAAASASAAPAAAR
jgi:tetratricopeptide (TPR) repeat protein